MPAVPNSRKNVKSRKKLSQIPRIVPKAKDYEDKGLFAKGGFDIIFLLLVCVLLTIGVVMMFSASYISAKNSATTGGDPYYYLKRQAIFAVIGLVAMLLISKINHNVFRKIAPIFFVISFALLVIVLFAPAEVDGKEQFKRWLEIPVIGLRFQPSEVAKFGLIIFLAWAFERYQKHFEIRKWTMTFIFFGIVIGFAVLVFAEDHLSGAILMLGIGLLMGFLGGVDWKLYALGALFAVLAVVIVIVYVKNIPDEEKELQNYMIKRIISWLDKNYTDTDQRYQTNQSLFALGSGGFFGLGLGNSKQKFLYLPEPQNDFIFAIVGEELGFLGCAFIVVLFALLVWRGFSIALKARSVFGRLITMGIVVQVGLQTILNILVVTDMMPNTGISLPFFSYGGSSLVMLLAEMGFVLSVSRSSRISKKH
ncbi:MAG: putative lipid II flippase FtsW [Clostridia bacterium]|nr:putative lipid II flippase FtsW [Clostridia bacterium]